MTDRPDIPALREVRRQLTDAAQRSSPARRPSGRQAWRLALGAVGAVTLVVGGMALVRSLEDGDSDPVVAVEPSSTSATSSIVTSSSAPSAVVPSSTTTDLAPPAVSSTALPPPSAPETVCPLVPSNGEEPSSSMRAGLALPVRAGDLLVTDGGVTTLVRSGSDLGVVVEGVADPAVFDLSGGVVASTASGAVTRITETGQVVPLVEPATMEEGFEVLEVADIGGAATAVVAWWIGPVDGDGDAGLGLVSVDGSSVRSLGGPSSDVWAAAWNGDELLALTIGSDDALFVATIDLDGTRDLPAWASDGLRAAVGAMVIDAVPRLDVVAQRGGVSGGVASVTGYDPATGIELWRWSLPLGASDDLAGISVSPDGAYAVVSVAPGPEAFRPCSFVLDMTTGEVTMIGTPGIAVVAG